MTIGPSDIGTAGQAGFGVGVSLPALPAGYTYLGTNNRAGANFGRYLNAASQPETWVPACWLRIGSSESPRFAAFGTDAVDALPLRAYYNLPDAAADGYFLHPALDVNGQILSGFFAGVSLTANQLDYVSTLYSAGVQVNPLILFSNGEQGAWYDPSDLSTLFQDAAGITPVTAAGQPVGLMLDKSGRNNHARQTTAAARPLYRTDGVRHWLEFDGVDDFLSTAAFAWNAGTSVYSAAVRKNTETPTGAFLEFSAASDASAGGYILFHNQNTVNGFGLNAKVPGGGTSVVTRLATAGFPAPVDAVATGLMDSAAQSLILRLNSTPSGSGSGTFGPGVLGTHPLYLGIRGGTTFPLNGGIYGAILRNVLPTAGQLSMIESYLASKSGVVLS